MFALLCAVALAGSSRQDEESQWLRLTLKTGDPIDRWSADVRKAIAGLDGACESTYRGHGTFSVRLKGKSTPRPAEIRKALGSFTLEQIEATLVGKVAREKTGPSLTLPSGTRVRLTPTLRGESFESQIDGWIRSGRTEIRVFGILGDSGELSIASAEIAEPWIVTFRFEGNVPEEDKKAFSKAVRERWLAGRRTSEVEDFEPLPKHAGRRVVEAKLEYSLGVYNFAVRSYVVLAEADEIVEGEHPEGPSGSLKELESMGKVLGEIAYLP